VLRGGLGKHLHFVVAGEHDIEGFDSEPRHLQVGLAGSAAIEQVTDLHDPETSAAVLVRVQRPERAQQRPQQIDPSVDIPDNDLDHRCPR
jgi:hypothetical protein